MKYRANFHTHTTASFDGYNTYRAIYKNCIRRGINLIAITDHDTMEGAFGFEKWLIDNKKGDLTIIKGEEITCSDGTHIIGLFLNALIMSDTPINVIGEIKKQGGLVYFPHPARKDGIMKSYQYEKAIQLGDAFEVFNAKINNSFNIEAITEYLKFNHLIPLAGSDAHYNSDLLKCFCELNLNVDNLKESLKEIKKGSIKIKGFKKGSGGNQYFESYYKVKNKFRIPKLIKEIGKILFPLYKNFKERKKEYELSTIDIK